MLNEQEAYLKNVQATYRYYCYHVHNDGRAVDEIMWKPSRFHMFLCNKVQEFVEKPTEKAFEILILNTPPQFGKSLTISETFPSWYIMRNPEKSVILISYGDDLAEKFGKANLQKVKAYGNIFGIALDKKKSKAREFQLLKHKGRMISKGFGSGLTGHTGNLILIDDPIKNRIEADSETTRNHMWEEFNDSVLTRLNAGDKLILIMTRWHEDDLAGRIIREMHDRTTVINLPCEAEEDDPLGREAGEPLCPEIGRDKAWVEDKKASITTEEGLRTWNALYQGRPTSKEGNILQREWWQYYMYEDYANGNLELDTILLSVDAAFKDKEKNDYVAIEVWGKRKNRIYLIDLINEHLNFMATIKKIRLLKVKYPNAFITLIEDAANGTAIIQYLKNEIMGVIPISPDKSKEARAQGVSAFIEAGNVFLPKDKKFTFEFIDQCASFPNGKHDDMVDSMSMALSRLIYNRTMRKIKNKARADGFSFTREKRKTAAALAGNGEEINVI